MVDAPREWLIKKGGYFYRPNKSGYTTSKFDAGRYTEDDAQKECEIEPWHMKAVHQDEVPDDAPSESIASLERQLAEIRAERDRQYDENVSLIAENASIVAERDRLAAENEALREREESAREFVKRHPALSLIDLAEFEAFLKVPAAFRALTDGGHDA